MKKIFNYLLAIFLLFFLSTAFAMDNFVVRGIDVQGLQHIQRSTVMHYLPIRVGQTFTSAKGDVALADLYKTGFFSNIVLDRSGNNLIVRVTEFPAIAAVNISGNKAIPQKDLAQVQQKAGLVEGQVFNAAALKLFVEGLRQQYLSQGYYHAKIDTKVVNTTHNLVNVNINVDQGSLARVERIRILGNHAFSEDTLLNEISLSTPNLLSFFTDSDRYSEQKLQETEQNLSDFYLNRGYLRFNILSKEASIAPDGNGMLVTITIFEGQPYTISGYSLPANLSADEVKKINEILKYEKGTVFSRQTIVDNNNDIASFLGNQGYAFPNISADPVLDDTHHTVFLQYHIVNGRQVYVRHANFSGNNTTEEKVLRFSTRQMEGSLYSKASVDESKRRLSNLPYFTNVRVTPVPVKNSKDLVDLDYKVDEKSAGQASIMGGYSDIEGFLYGASVSQANLLGTGKYGSIGFQKSAYQQSYNLAYNNPFYTVYGMSRGFNLSFSKTTPGQVHLSTYTQDTASANINYGMPITEYDTLNFGYGYEYDFISTEADLTPQSIQDFVTNYGDTFHEAVLSGGWSHSTLDQIPLSTSGVSQSIGLNLYAPLTKKSLTYYKTNYQFNSYVPLDRKRHWVFNTHATLGYGDGLFNTRGLPFFENYYAGGISTVPGYTGNTLGPKAGSPAAAVGTAMGGNILMAGGIDLIFPNHISDSLRTALTLNGGNVYAGQIDLRQLRYSAGLMIIWQSPLGPLDFSIAKALNPQSGDDLRPFDFSMGATF